MDSPEKSVVKKPQDFCVSKTLDDFENIIVKCPEDDCCNGLYHCPLCSKFKPAKPHKVRQHIRKSHMMFNITHNGLYILRCLDRCRVRPHYHCCETGCYNTYINKSDMLDHLRKHEVDSNYKAETESRDSFDDQMVSEDNGTEHVMKSDSECIVGKASEQRKINASEQLTETATEQLIGDDSEKVIGNTTEPLIGNDTNVMETATEKLIGNASKKVIKNTTDTHMGNDTNVRENATEKLIGNASEKVIKNTTEPHMGNDTKAKDKATEQQQGNASEQNRSSSTKTVRHGPEKVVCDVCNLTLTRSNLSRHMLRKHDHSFYEATCVDALQGLYLVNKSKRGTQSPLHVQYKNSGKMHTVVCENKNCEHAKKIRFLSGKGSFTCQHILACQNVISHSEKVEIRSETVDSCLKEKIINEDSAKQVRESMTLSSESNTPIIAEMDRKRNSRDRYRFFSVIEKNQHHWSIFKRVITSFDTVSKEFHCKCISIKRNCVHKSITKCYLVQTNPELIKSSSEEDVEGFQKSRTDETASESLRLKSDSGKVLYPPSGAKIQEMVQYIYKNKKIPYCLAEESTDMMHENIPKTSFHPRENICSTCKGPLTQEVLITRSAKIVTMQGVLSGRETYCKLCKTCNQMYRYQEYEDGVFNYDDYILLSHRFCLHLRSGLQNHIAIGRSISTLRGYIPDTLPADWKITNAYLAFEALTDRSYGFFCMKCGYFPSILTLDLCKKSCFDIDVSSIPESDVELSNDQIDVDEFWGQVCMEILARGFLKDGMDNPFHVKPLYSYWGPWMCPKSRQSHLMFNTEYLKCSPHLGNPSDRETVFIDAERLTELASGKKRAELVCICKASNIPTANRSSCDMLEDLRKSLIDASQYAKVFRNIHGQTGGFVAGSCIHGIVYCMKFVLRAESVRDYADLLFSFRYPPNVVIVDMPHMLSTHANLRQPGFFNPYAGKVCESTERNIELAKDGKLDMDYPWLTEKQNAEGLEAHPVTGTSVRLCLADTFHENNSKRPDSVLRQTKNILQLRGRVNTQTAEQLFSQTGKDNYFVNMMGSSNHIFVERFLIDDMNMKKNLKAITELKGLLQQELTISNIGTLLIDSHETRHVTEEEMTANSLKEDTLEQCDLDECQKSDITSSRQSNIGETLVQDQVLLDLVSCVGETIDEPVPEHNISFSNVQASRSFWEKPLYKNELSMVHAVLRDDKMEDEPIVTVDNKILNRKDLKTLRRNQSVECKIINACLSAVCSIAAAKNKRVGFINGYAVPTWIRHVEETPAFEGILPGFKNLQKILIPVYRPGHWCLCVIDVEKKTVWYLDPLYQNPNNRNQNTAEKAMMRRVVEVNFNTGQSTLEDAGWCFNEGYHDQDLPAQHYGSDCGIFIIMYSLYKSLDSQYDFDVTDMPRLRIWLVLILIENYKVRSSRGDVCYSKFAPWSDFATNGVDPMPERHRLHDRNVTSHDLRENPVKKKFSENWEVPPLAKRPKLSDDQHADIDLTDSVDKTEKPEHDLSNEDGKSEYDLPDLVETAIETENVNRLSYSERLKEVAKQILQRKAAIHNKIEEETYLEYGPYVKPKYYKDTAIMYNFLNGVVLKQQFKMDNLVVWSNKLGNTLGLTMLSSSTNSVIKIVLNASMKNLHEIYSVLVHELIHAVIGVDCTIPVGTPSHGLVFKQKGRELMRAIDLNTKLMPTNMKNLILDKKTVLTAHS